MISIPSPERRALSLAYKGAPSRDGRSKGAGSSVEKEGT